MSDKALKCPSCGAQLRKAKRSIIGKIFKWAFILFNVFMAWWLFSAIGNVAEMPTGQNSDAYKAGAVIGSAIGFSMIAGIWLVGDVILGLFVLFTKPKN